MSKFAITTALIGTIIGSFWAGVFLTTLYNTMFSYEPCWQTLSDVYDEAEYQDSLRKDPTMTAWNFMSDTPKLVSGCVLVDDDKKYNGFRKLNYGERLPFH